MRKILNGSYVIKALLAVYSTIKTFPDVQCTHNSSICIIAINLLCSIKNSSKIVSGSNRMCKSELICLMVIKGLTLGTHTQESVILHVCVCACMRGGEGERGGMLATPCGDPANTVDSVAKANNCRVVQFFGAVFLPQACNSSFCTRYDQR